MIGYTTGVFDLFHIGHLNIISQAARQCDHLIVGVTTDELAATEKGRRPVVPYEERSAIVAAVRGVAEVVPQDNIDKLLAWEQLQFNKIFVGTDWQGSARWSALEAAFSDRGVQVVYFPYTEHTSSSHLRSVLDFLSRDSAGQGG